MTSPPDYLLDLLKKHFGFDFFRNHQWEAIQDILAGRDSVVVLPTGGGKSLCYQIPALAKPGLAVVISPLIALMKDQVDALVDCGVPAAAVNSTHTPEERRHTAAEIRAGRLKLLYVSPEKICTDAMKTFLREQELSLIAIDEAHCVSTWGHDFRPEYRLLGQLRDEFPGVSFHAFTATATEQVRADIAAQLHLHQPAIHVGNFDRPNLVYRVKRRGTLQTEIEQVLARHPQEAGIIYAITRKEVDNLAATLVRAGHKAVPYHAGLTNDVRQKNQDAFLNEKADIVVATTAFGMGIDKSNVRFVIHAAAPRSLENYQQESGRAGRDGLEAECCLFYGPADFLSWKRLQSDLVGAAAALANEHLATMERFCQSVGCRHKALVEHFGQAYGGERCGACDACLDQLELVAEPLVLGQKILSCVLRVQENFGAEYVVQVLLGSREQRILENQHDQLSTYGLLKDESKSAVRDWIEQLVGQDFLAREGEYRLLCVTDRGRELLRGQATPQLLKAAVKAKKEKSAAGPPRSMEGVDPGLFAHLRKVRRELADEKGLPPFIVFGDVTLQDLCRRRPASLDAFRAAHGVGAKKSEEYGARFVQEITDYCTANNLPLDAPPAAAPVAVPKSEPRSTLNAQAAARFEQGQSLAEVAAALGWVESTAAKHLVEFLQQTGRTSAQPWVSAENFARIQDAAADLGLERLKPLFERFEERISYDELRIARAVLGNQDRAAE